MDIRYNLPTPISKVLKHLWRKEDYMTSNIFKANALLGQI